MPESDLDRRTRREALARGLGLGIGAGLGGYAPLGGLLGGGLGSSMAAARAPARTRPATAADPFPLPAHAHNDYVHDRPLLDALEHAYRSIEVDVFPGDADLLVAHDPEDVVPERRITNLYLDPLQDWIAARDGTWNDHPDAHDSLLLLVDCKRDGRRCLDILESLLRDRPELVTPARGDEGPTGPVRIALSGNRPVDRILGDEARDGRNRFATLDGRPDDLGQGHPQALIPLVSAPWRWLTDWLGVGRVPPTVRADLRDHVRRCHDEGRLVRLWGTPPTRAVWEFQIEEGVDLVNVDDLSGFRRWYERRESSDGVTQ